MYFSYAVECADWDYIFTPDINEFIRRYNMHKQGIYSYSQIYDELPVLWIDVLNILSKEEHESVQAYQRIKKNG